MKLDLFQNQKGMTLVETIVSVAVALFAILAVVGANIAIQQTGEGVYQRSIAIQDANQIVERMRDAARDVEDFPDDLVTLFPDGSDTGDFDNLTNEEVSVDYADVTADPLDVIVTVTWLENGRRETEAQLRTLITQR